MKRPVYVQVQLPVMFLRERRKFVAYTPALDLSTSGDTFAEVKRRFDEVVLIFLSEISRRGTFEEVLRDLGWQKHDRRWVPPEVIGQTSTQVSVPVSVRTSG